MSFDVSKFLKGVGEGQRRALAASLRGTEQFANHVVGKAQKLAPVATGALKASGIAEPPSATGSKITAVVGFNTNYAAAVHERLDQHHDQGQAKYLETPMRTEARKLPTFIQQEVRKAL